jgi:anti-sigma regulatory factor (Ser/Thr protein kinase)
VSFAPSRIGPLIELAFEANAGRHGPLLHTPWLDLFTQRDLRAALEGADNVWLDGTRRRGFLRTVFDPLNANDDTIRTSFLIAARVSAQASGFPIPIAQGLAAAIREMESNIREHSGRAETGILAFQALPSAFEFVVADCGIGVLATLRESSEFKSLSDHGRALHAALQDDVSRYGRGSGRGNGFRDLFLGLAGLNADLRFRSGDHALTISGPRPDLKRARLDQKVPFQGLLASVRCQLPGRPSVTH